MHPRVLKWMFDQLDETLMDDSVTQRQVIKEFDRRKLDTKYFGMLQSKKKKQVWVFLDQVFVNNFLL